MLMAIIVFTHHKAASVFFYQFYKRVAQELDYYFVSSDLRPDENGYVPEKGLTDLGCWNNQEVIICPVRTPELVPSAALSSTNVKVLHIRDPRDALVSMYYSWLYSHPRTDDFNPSPDQIAEWQHQGIDNFVLAEEDLKTRLELYVQLAANGTFQNVFTYENMVTDFSNWINAVTCQLPDLPIGTSRQLYLEFKDQFNRSGEDIFDHRRQISPGDHLRKLKPDTIEQLNRKYEKVLRYFKYT